MNLVDESEHRPLYDKLLTPSSFSRKQEGCPGSDTYDTPVKFVKR